jgi:hypothetical protein
LIQFILDNIGAIALEYRRDTRKVKSHSGNG